MMIGGTTAQAEVDLQEREAKVEADLQRERALHHLVANRVEAKVEAKVAVEAQANLPLLEIDADLQEVRAEVKVEAPVPVPKNPQIPKKITTLIILKQ